MKRSLLIFAAAVAGSLGLAVVARAAVVELGATTDAPPVSCPDHDCTAIARVTGYQVLQRGSRRHPFLVRRSGKVVAFTLQLGRPSESQTERFTARFMRGPTARLGILRPGRRARRRLVAQSEVVDVARYLGSAPTFALRRPLRVAKGDIVALTVPTWLPAFSVNLGRDHSWRASRPPDQCGDRYLFRPAAHQRLRTTKVYGCSYTGARLRYSATFVPDPEPTS